MLRQVRNYRFDPFSETSSFTPITKEIHMIPKSGTYWVRLDEVPDKDYSHPTSGTPLHVTNYAESIAFSEVVGTPGAYEFRVDYDYKTAWVEFNSSNAGMVIKCSYRGTGSPVEGELVNSLQRFQTATEIFCGDGSDGTVTLTAGALSESPAGSGICLKQYENLVINGTVSLAAGVRGLILAVKGLLQMNQSIDVRDNGGAGGAASTADGEDGGYGGGGGGSSTALYKGGDGGSPSGPGLAAPFGPGAGSGGQGTASAGTDAENLVLAGDDMHWRSLVNQMVYGAGGGAGYGAGQDGGNGAGFIIINCNVFEHTAGTLIAAGRAGSGTYGGGGAGGTVIVIANHIVGMSAATVESSHVSITGGAGTTYGGNGADGYKRVIELYEHNLY